MVITSVGCYYHIGVEVKDVAKHPTMHRTHTTTLPNNYLVKNVNSATVQKFYTRPILLSLIFKSSLEPLPSQSDTSISMLFFTAKLPEWIVQMLSYLFFIHFSLFNLSRLASITPFFWNYCCQVPISNLWLSSVDSMSKMYLEAIHFFPFPLSPPLSNPPQLDPETEP